MPVDLLVLEVLAFLGGGVACCGLAGTFGTGVEEGDLDAEIIDTTKAPTIMA